MGRIRVALAVVLIGLALFVGYKFRARVGKDYTVILPDGYAYADQARQWFFADRSVPPAPVWSFRAQLPEGPPGSCRPPGYPLFLGAVTHGPVADPQAFFEPTKRWQRVLDLLTCGWVLLLAWRLGGRVAGAVGLTLAVLCPTLALYTTVILTETLATFLLTSTVGLLLLAPTVERRRLRQAMYGLAGVAAAASALVRPDGVLAAAYAVLLPLLFAWPRSGEPIGPALRRSLPAIVVAVVPFVLLLSLWPLRNWARFGRPHLYSGLCDIRNQPLRYTSVSRWLATWMTDESELPSSLWCLLKPYCMATVDDYPATAFDSPAESEFLGRLLRQRNARGINADVDSGFALLARHRLRRHPLRTLVELPLRRAYHMLVGVNDLPLRGAKTLPWPRLFEPLQARQEKLHRRSLQLAAVGLLWLLARRPTRRAGLAILLVLLGRILGLAVIGAVESRYLTELLPLWLVLDGVAVGGAVSGLAAAVTWAWRRLTATGAAAT